MGARMHYAVPRVLMHSNMLAKFYTDFYFFQGGSGQAFDKFIKILPGRIGNRISSRRSHELPDSLIRANQWLGVEYAIARQLVRNQTRLDKVLSAYNSRFAEWVGKGDLEGIDTIYAVNGAALELFEIAMRHNIRCILEQVIAPYSVLDRLLQEEYVLWSGWEENTPESYGQEMSLRESQEWEVSDKIVAGSYFVVDGLVSCGVPVDRCSVLPYAIDVNKYVPKTVKTNRAKADPLKILFLGTVTLRKGIQYLYEALRMLDRQSIIVKVAGKNLLGSEATRKLQDHCTLLGRVPRSHADELFQWADLLVLPSICEGSALVTYEALSSGLPVITTPNAGSVVRDGVDGFIVPIRDSEALASVLESVLHEPEMLISMSQAARQHAVQELSLEAYQERLVRAIIDSLSQ